MPVFLSGLSFARVAAASFQVPLLTTTHQRGHVRAALEDSGLKASPYLALHLSGGTTEVLLMDREERLTLLAGTRDLHAGQLIDRVGVALGLPFPAGPSLEKLAMTGAAQSLLPVSSASRTPVLSAAAVSRRSTVRSTRLNTSAAICGAGISPA